MGGGRGGGRGRGASGTGGGRPGDANLSAMFTDDMMGLGSPSGVDQFALGGISGWGDAMAHGDSNDFADIFKRSNSHLSLFAMDGGAGGSVGPPPQVLQSAPPQQHPLQQPLLQQGQQQQQQQSQQQSLGGAGGVYAQQGVWNGAGGMMYSRGSSANLDQLPGGGGGGGSIGGVAGQGHLSGGGMPLDHVTSYGAQPAVQAPGAMQFGPFDGGAGAGMMAVPQQQMQPMPYGAPQSMLPMQPPVYVPGMPSATAPPYGGGGYAMGGMPQAPYAGGGGGGGGGGGSGDFATSVDADQLRRQQKEQQRLRRAAATQRRRAARATSGRAGAGASGNSSVVAAAGDAGRANASGAVGKSAGKNKTDLAQAQAISQAMITKAVAQQAMLATQASALIRHGTAGGQALVQRQGAGASSADAPSHMLQQGADAQRRPGAQWGTSAQAPEPGQQQWAQAAPLNVAVPGEVLAMEASVVRKLQAIVSNLDPILKETIRQSLLRLAASARERKSAAALADAEATGGGTDAPAVAAAATAAAGASGAAGAAAAARGDRDGVITPPSDGGSGSAGGVSSSVLGAATSGLQGDADGGEPSKPANISRRDASYTHLDAQAGSGGNGSHASNPSNSEDAGASGADGAAVAGGVGGAPDASAGGGADGAGTPKDKVVLREVVDRTVANLLFHRYDPGEKQHVSDGGPCDVPNADDPAAGGKAVKVEPESDAA